jgi:hypothetical protein
MDTITLNILLCAMMAVETGCNPLAHNVKKDAVGVLQIRPIMVEDVNRIIGEEVYTLDDRRDVVKSFQMAYIYFRHYCKGFTPEQKARCWNGGPEGHLKESTKAYWDKVLVEIERLFK